MGVYIKGMEMPKSCSKCACYKHKYDSGWYDYDVCEAAGMVFNDGYSSVTVHIDPFKERLDNCPLVELPPHGRLIDADAFLAKTKEDPLFPLVERYGMSRVIEAQPTIIPAEEADGNV